MRAATEGSLPPVVPQGNLVEVLGREVRQGSPGEFMESVCYVHFSQVGFRLGFGTGFTN